MPSVIGKIREKWESVGGQNSFLGQPLTDELTTPDRVGRFNHFQGGSIYWTPQLGAHIIHGAIRDKWASLGYERGFLGYPTTDQSLTPHKQGEFIHFGSASIYWSAGTGAHIVLGDIRTKWAGLGWENSFLGFPLTDELPTPDRIGRFNHFQGGSIYWTPETGAHEVHGAIRDKWAQLGWERSFLGYPTHDELPATDGNGRISYFTGGALHWKERDSVNSSPQTPFHIKVLLTGITCRDTESVHGADAFTFYGSMYTHENSTGVALDMLPLNDNQWQGFYKILFDSKTAIRQVGMSLKAYDLDRNKAWFENKDKVGEIIKVLSDAAKQVPKIGDAAKIGIDVVAKAIPLIGDLLANADKDDLLGTFDAWVDMPDPESRFVIYKAVPWNFRKEDDILGYSSWNYSVALTVVCE